MATEWTNETPHSTTWENEKGHTYKVAAKFGIGIFGHSKFGDTTSEAGGITDWDNETKHNSSWDNETKH